MERKVEAVLMGGPRDAETTEVTYPPAAALDTIEGEKYLRVTAADIEPAIYQFRKPS